MTHTRAAPSCSRTPTTWRARIDADDLDVTADDVLVLRNAGPVGAPGMPESGYLPIPRKLARAGVKDMVRISDARMSGTAFGTIVLHIAPEVGRSAARWRWCGPATGSASTSPAAGSICWSMPPNWRPRAGRLEAAARRRPGRSAAMPACSREHVLQADEGCDFDLLRAAEDEV